MAVGEYFHNIYSSISESSYTVHLNLFPELYIQNNLQKLTIQKIKKAKMAHLPKIAALILPDRRKVYLQPDNEGLLENQKTGYNAYCVTS